MTLIWGDCSLLVSGIKERDSRFKQNVLRLQVAMDQPRILEYCQTFKQLLRKDLDQLSTQPLELILLNQLVEIGRQTLED
jgi:hypothetical protein